MKISGIIKRFEEIKKEYGNKNVLINDPEEGIFLVNSILTEIADGNLVLNWNISEHEIKYVYGGKYYGPDKSEPENISFVNHIRRRFHGSNQPAIQDPIL